MKKKFICLLLVLVTICLLVACSSSPKEARAQISDPITITNVKKNNGDPAATPSEKGYYTDNEFFHGSITLTLPEGLTFAVSFNKGDVLDTSWYVYKADGIHPVDSSLKVKNDVSVGDTEIELEIHINYDSSYEGSYTFTLPNSIFNADYVGENPVFEFCIPRMS